MIVRNNKSLSLQYEKAQDRQLEITPFGIHWKVSSFSHKGEWHFVHMEEDGATCSCPAGLSDTPCSHVALALAISFPALARQWSNESHERFNQQRLNIATGKAGKGRMAYYKRVFNKFHSENVEVGEIEVTPF